MEDYHVYLIWDKYKDRPYYVGKWGGVQNTFYITGSSYLKRYIQIFGKDQFWNRFEKRRLESVMFLEDLNKTEEYYIEKYQTFRNGGNRTKGGTYDWKYRTPNKVPVLQYDLNGNFIREWSSQKEPYREGVIERYSGISSCIRGLQESSGGYIWKEKISSNYPKKITPVTRKHNPINKEVQHFDKHNNLLGTYKTPKECSRLVGIPYVILTTLLKGTRVYKYWKEQTFRYKDTQWRKSK